jgi:hypothetical protein
MSTESTKALIESLSMDLLRTALGLHRKSFRMAERFKQESLKILQELESRDLKDVKLIALIQKTKNVFELNKEDMHEDLLMYSTLFQNYAIHRIS